MYLCVEDIGLISFYVFVCWWYRFYPFLCICVLRISVLPLSMSQIFRKRSNRYRQHTNTYKEVKPISSTHINIERGKTDILNTQIHRKWYPFLCICVLRISVLALSMYLVFVCWRYRFYLFQCICVLRISVLPLSMYLCVKDIEFTSLHVRKK
jgi:hypothetical protein